VAVPRLSALAGVLVLAAAFLALGSATSAPPFASSVRRVGAADLRWSWRPGCPVAPGELRRVRLAYWGFDGHRQLGELVVHRDAVDAVAGAFRRLYEDRFPIRRITAVDAYRGSDDASMAADNTSAFNCRAAVAAGPRRWSEHAYGRAVDVNPVENPYLAGGRILPPAGRAYLDRTRYRAGMAIDGGVLVRAFAAVGWGWGGRWEGSRDYQHFSATGR
jgi:D-alanyl-D-alanine carboxypeptidase